jgi:hypothetical protein
MNVGAEKPEDYGLFFAWGETTGYTSDTSDGRSFDWVNYKWCNGSQTTMTKYCANASYGTVDNQLTLLPADDAARANWGGEWSMPTIADIEELIDNTTSEWTTENSVNGRKFTAANGNSIFLPAAGCRANASLDDQSTCGRYWSALVAQLNSNSAWYLGFDSRGTDTNYLKGRLYGFSVRPVLRK